MSFWDCLDNHRVVPIFRVPHQFQVIGFGNPMVATWGNHCRTCNIRYPFASPVYVDVTLWLKDITTLEQL